MLNPRLAGRYAKSLIDLAVERNELEAVFNDMDFLNQICTGSKEFVTLMKSPVITSDKKEKILDALTGGKISIMTETFTRLLIRKNREAFLPEIVTAFIQQYKDLKGVHIVTLTTASPISDELKQAIVDKVRATTSMQQIELHALVKEDLIGGFVLETGDLLVDASIAFDLHNIRKQFQNNDFIYKLR